MTLHRNAKTTPSSRLVPGPARGRETPARGTGPPRGRRAQISLVLFWAGPSYHRRPHASPGGTITMAEVLASTASSGHQPAADGVLYDPLCEVRFAMVIYGGVSLAIYINGIVQEVLSLVRATAPATAAQGEIRPLLASPAAQSGSEKVYRKLGQMFSLAGSHDDLQEVWQQVQSGATPPIRARFVMDVLSGTSAGGINAMFLAKALAANAPLRKLQTLWQEEGDIVKLINDKASLEASLRPQQPPQSLLNSQRMYQEAARCPRRHGRRCRQELAALAARGRARSLLHDHRHRRPDAADHPRRPRRGRTPPPQRLSFPVRPQGPQPEERLRVRGQPVPRLRRTLHLRVPVRLRADGAVRHLPCPADDARAFDQAVLRSRHRPVAAVLHGLHR